MSLELTDIPAPKREDTAYLLAAIHAELKKQDGSKEVGRYGNITNTNFELFVERFEFIFHLLFRLFSFIYNWD